MAQLSISNLFPSSFINDPAIRQSLGEELSLCDSGNIVFHWADFYETCDAVKSQVESNQELIEDFKKREQALSKLSFIPIWIRTHSKVHQTTVFDLYEKYILNQFKSIGLDPFEPLEISFISGTGPFKNMALAECFNHSTYKDFVMLYLLNEKLPKRDFRVRLKAKVLAEYGKEFDKAQLIQLEQLTTNGLLFSVDSENFLSDISKTESLRILIDTKVLKEGNSKNLIEMKEVFSKYAFNLMYSSNKDDAVVCPLKDFSVQSSFDFLKAKKVFLFVSYDKLRPSHPMIVKNIQSFIEHSREVVRNHYKDKLQVKSA
jgi:hypothetical protein